MELRIDFNGFYLISVNNHLKYKKPVIISAWNDIEYFDLPFAIIDVEYYSIIANPGTMAFWTLDGFQLFKISCMGIY